MFQRYTEIPVLVGNILKWLIFGSGVGVIVGLSTAAFLAILNVGVGLTSALPNPFLLLPVGLLISAWLTTRVAPEAAGHGTERLIQAIHLRAGKMNASVIPIKLVATILTIVPGGSAGNIGPCAQIGGGLTSLVSDLLRFDDADRKKLVVCGMSAGFAAVFGTPIAGALFGAEVLFIGRFFYGILFPSVIAAVVASHVASMLGVAHATLPVITPPNVSLTLVSSVAFSGLLFGGCALLFIECLEAGKRLVQRTHLQGMWLGAIGGLLLLGLGFVFSEDMLGVGTETLHQALSGEKVLWYIFLLKILATSLTLNIGGSGGIILPICFVGATAGSTFANIAGLDLQTFAALGFVGVLAGATNTPLTAIVLATELFGPALLPYAAISCAASYLMTGHRSAIPTQLLEFTKSSSLDMDMGKEIHSTQASFDPHGTTLSPALFKLFTRKKKS